MTVHHKRPKDMLGRAAGDLYPGYFALVMATGIVSIDAFWLEMAPLAYALFYLNIVAYAVLWLLTLIRLLRYRPRLIADMTDHTKAPGFLTAVAGTCVLGSQFALLVNDTAAAAALWIFGIGLWLVLIYAFFVAMTVREQKPRLESGLNGSWLLVVVSTQSVSVLGTTLASHLAADPNTILFFTLAMFLIGCLLYIPIISLIFYRWMFFDLAQQALTPPYWINMGAMAITTLAGAKIILSASDWLILSEILPFLKGLTLLFWATATWWIPLLVILGIWRYALKRYPLIYDPQYWGLVFPLGMYTACTLQLAKAFELDFLLLIPGVFVYVTLLAWLATFAGLLHRQWRLWRVSMDIVPTC